MNRRTLFSALLAAVPFTWAGRAARAYATNSYYAGPVSDHFDGTRFFVPGHPFQGSFGRLMRWQFGGGRARWPASWPSPHADAPPTRVDRNGLRVTHIGHASFLIQATGLNILVDPVFSDRASPVQFAGPKRVNPPGIALPALPPIDAVLVSHGHYDHLDLASLAEIHARWRPQIVCPLGNDAVIAAAIPSARIQALDWGGHFALGDLSVHILPSYHWSARGLLDRHKTLWCSFVLHTPAGAVYHIADTGYGDGRFFREAGRGHGPFRLAILPIGAYEPRWFMQGQHVNPAESVRIFQDCGAEQAIGHHWGTFQLTNEPITQPETDLQAALAAAGIAPERFRAFRPGQAWDAATA